MLNAASGWEMFQVRKLANNHSNQAQKFGSAEPDMSEEELGEDSVLLESPLDKLDPYSIFRASLMSKYLWRNTAALELPFSPWYMTDIFLGLQQEQPQFYASLTSHLSAEEQGIITGVFQQAETQAILAQQATAVAAQGAGASVNGTS
jgi:importin-7